jgi:hypothetical protein
VSSDDGYRLYLDGVLIGSSDGVTSNQIVPATPILVTAGTHFIRLELREDFGEAKMKLERKTSSSTTWNVIGNTNFRAGVDNNGNGVLDLCDSGDCNRNYVPDSVDLAANAALDCNGDGFSTAATRSRSTATRMGFRIPVNRVSSGSSAATTPATTSAGPLSHGDSTRRARSASTSMSPTRATTTGNPPACPPTTSPCVGAAR